MRKRAIAVRMAIVGGVAAVVMSSLAVLAGPAGGAPCECAASAPAVGEAEAVFQGTLTAAVAGATDRPDPSDAGPRAVAYTFRVERVLQGAVGDTIVVHAPMTPDGCASMLTVGQRYEVRTHATASGLEVCTDGGALQSDVLAIRRNGAPLTVVDGPDRFLVVGLAGLAVVLGLGVAALALDHVRRARNAPKSLPTSPPGPGAGAGAPGDPAR